MSNNRINQALLNPTKQAQNKMLALLLNHKLYEYAFDGNANKVEECLKKGADPDFSGANVFGDTPLLTASFHGHMKVVALLLAHGAAVDKCNLAGCTPLWTAIKHHHNKVALLLMSEGANVSHEMTPSRATPLHIASGANNLDMAAVLLEKGVDIEAQTDEGHTPLHLAASNSSVGTLTFLLAHKANHQAQTKDAQITALQLALEKQSAPCVAALLAAGAAQNKAFENMHGKRGYTPFLCAIHEGFLAGADLLVNNGVSIDQVNLQNGNTGLHIAITKNDRATVAWLLTHGASLTIRNKNHDETPMEMAFRYKDNEMLEWILTHIRARPGFNSYLKEFIQSIADKENHEFDLVDFIHLLQNIEMSNESILSLLPTRLTSPYVADEHSLIGITVRNLTGRQPQVMRRPSIAAGLPQALVETCNVERYEPMRQKLLAMAFNPTTNFGAGLIMHGTKENYGLEEKQEVASLSPRK